MARSKPLLYCSFCRRDSHTVRKLIGGPGVYICDVCVELCNRVLAGKSIPEFPGWGSLSDKQLLRALLPSVTAVDAVRDVLQQQVDLLRERGSSWAKIGDALSISRQAAWERFS